ncbi:CPBP family intramembrane glutamic endopeptidase [Usitatibacter palustris]|uniref:CAAX prenyl protease 2/Lysostaphin resistance protein A-like domain-containing protein n=1 Tax=Usitatibacter palustris TaxID=2732487 RepID=A0A6M4H5M3_9PROT|nr:CPBP family intramembrane glutamic endopeptidase [Usitatibacter palustris]QJR14951.1 hypothetical protein DSM104440_01766 [Usitatibacter palustris]
MPLRDHWRGHLLLFDQRPPTDLAPAACLKLALVFVLLECVLGPRLWLLDALGIAQPPAAIRVAVLLALALLLVRYLVRVPLAAIGLKRWSAWSLAEKSYFLQVVVAATAIFVALNPKILAVPALVLATNFAWGFYQEVVYRGILQTALVQRVGGVAGVLLANAIFTFGPLHFYHFSGNAPLPMFAAIFAIGLLFGAIFHRSGNLWIVAVFHGLGSAFLLR